MEIVDPDHTGHHHYAWLEWLGLEEPPPEPDSWVPVAQGFTHGARGIESAELAPRVVADLKAAGIDARLRGYRLYDAEAGSLYAAGHMEPCVAVLVHERDAARAVEVATASRRTLEAEEAARAGNDDDELTRLALESPPPPD